MLSPETLMHAYARGLFPMAEHRDAEDVFWLDPRLRGILPMDGFHISRSLARMMRRCGYEVSLNRDFLGVVDGCADRADTWINPQIRNSYKTLHSIGHAHSLEIWDGSALVGGVYGVSLGAAFFGESMFSRRRDTSKMALAVLMDLLRRTGFVLFDTQFITDHLASLGGVEIPRARYHAMLAEAIDQDADITSAPVGDVQGVLQRMTQTSNRS